jgi:glutamate-ammonia-ligase adenylyltransferase
VITEELKQAIRSLCSDIAEAVIQDFFTRMDEDYFTTFSPEEISMHVRMAASLGSRHRIQVHIRPRVSETVGTQAFDIVIVGFDYLSEFSIFCGLLSAYGLDIRAGNIYSFARREPQPSPSKIVDVFTVSIRSGEVFDAAEQHDFAHELETFANLLANGAAADARERLNRYLTERVETKSIPLSGLLSPLEITFENELSADWTMLQVRSEDSFGFLYAVSNALAMHGIDIHKVNIRNADGLAVDQFFIADQWGRKIDESRTREKLRVAVAMIKQFTRFLPEAPDPAKAMRHFDQFIDRVADEGFPVDVISFLAREEGMRRLARLFGSSDFLWDEFLSTRVRDLLPILESPAITCKDTVRADLRSQLALAASFEEKKRSLNSFKDRRVFLIEVQHLLDAHTPLGDFSDALTNLAEVIVDEAASICQSRLGGSGRFTICGLGKFGGREMGYASDLELIFVHEDRADTSYFEMLARETLDLIEALPKGIFHIDLRLRPYGDSGRWSTPFDEFTAYYSYGGQAAPFERQALIKLRWVAGDEDLGRRVEAHRDTFTYSGVRWDSENALHLRQRQIQELVKPNHINMKYSAGGIVDIEYAVQYLQLLHGRKNKELRLPNTLDALNALHRVRLINNNDFELLSGSYLFLRRVIDALRIVRGDASDLVLPGESSDEFKSLARRLGYHERDRKEGAAHLAADIREGMSRIHNYFLGRFGNKKGGS